MLNTELEETYFLDQMSSTIRTLDFHSDASKTKEGFYTIGQLTHDWKIMNRVFRAMTIVASYEGTISVAEDPEDHATFTAVSSTGTSFLQILSAYRKFCSSCGEFELHTKDETAFQAEKAKGISFVSDFYQFVSKVDPLLLTSPHHFWVLNDWCMELGLYRTDSQDVY